VSALARGVVNEVPWVAGESGDTAVELVSADCGSEPIVNSGSVGALLSGCLGSF